MVHDDDDDDNDDDATMMMMMMSGQVRQMGQASPATSSALPCQVLLGLKPPVLYHGFFCFALLFCQVIEAIPVKSYVHFPYPPLAPPKKNVGMALLCPKPPVISFLS